MKIGELHEKLFKMLMMFDSICRQHNIMYFLDSGCAIGAVREHDFIPWDDDVDIAILRPDYLRLRDILKTALPEHYRLIEPKDYEPFFFDFIPKLVDLTVPLREETAVDRAYHNYQNRMAIDFVILDKVPDSIWKQKIIKFKCKFFYGMARSKRYTTTAEHMSFSEKILSEVCYICGKMFSREKILKMYENNTTRYARIESNTVIRSNSLLMFIDFFNLNWYSDVVYMKFHGGDVPLPVGYDAVLTKMYGNYMVPQNQSNGFIIHFNSDDE